MRVTRAKKANRRVSPRRVMPSPTRTPTTSAATFTRALRGSASDRRRARARRALAATRGARAADAGAARGTIARRARGVARADARSLGGRDGADARRRDARRRATSEESEDDDVDWAREVDAGDGDGEFVVEAFDTRDDLARALCLEVEENARGCLQERGAFTMAVPGGSVAKALRGLREAEGLDWDRVHVFFVNERPGEQKCAKLAKETWTEACGIPDANVHCVMASDDVEACAADYEKQMRSLDENQMPIDEENGMPVFDLILLGMGADGHVGSIYPNSAAANDETGACVLGVDMPGKRTVTMSMALINTADRVVLAATGSEKAETVRAALEDELEWGEIPGSMVDAFSTIWFLDLAAASKLSAYEDMDMDTGDDE